MSSVEGSFQSKSSRDIVYKDYYYNDHEFFQLYDFTIAYINAIQNSSAEVIQDKLNKEIKRFKRIIACYFPFIIEKLDREPNFRDYSNNYLQDITHSSELLKLDTIPGNLAKPAPLPGHITHYFKYLEDWFNAFNPLKDKLANLQTNLDTKIKSKTSSYTERQNINFV